MRRPRVRQVRRPQRAEPHGLHLLHARAGGHEADQPRHRAAAGARRVGRGYGAAAAGAAEGEPADAGPGVRAAVAGGAREAEHVCGREAVAEELCGWLICGGGWDYISAVVTTLMCDTYVYINPLCVCAYLPADREGQGVEQRGRRRQHRLVHRRHLAFHIRFRHLHPRRCRLCSSPCPPRQHVVGVHLLAGAGAATRRPGFLGGAFERDQGERWKQARRLVCFRGRCSLLL